MTESDARHQNGKFAKRLRELKASRKKQKRVIENRFSKLGLVNCLLVRNKKVIKKVIVRTIYAMFPWVSLTYSNVLSEESLIILPAILSL